ncbi:ABC transporter ATP-binding protein [Granulosicoccus sp.]|nr:ABC transporter ATP-binding protein [Granulosicoccus sp.]MDB4224000.1 ABC transporter ATP-binding protein [Granulosicoccus sp.]
MSLTIRDNEFFTLLGPSGCGKTTLLRIIAGFENVTAGSVYLHGNEIAGLPANKRPVNTVFQQYSLFPHMSVEENVLFGLQMRNVPTAAARKRVAAMLELVQLEDFAQRLPSQLSGGQQQRVALARALAPEPEVLLLDEPLSALDLKLRQAMRIELKQIQEEAGITFIFVTHDQEEALTMSDRIAVMSAGNVQQIGSSHDIYEAPANRFVADFIGESNMLESSVMEQDNRHVVCSLPGGVSVSAESSVDTSQMLVGTTGHICIRPERLSLLPQGSTDVNTLKGVVVRHVYLGTDTQLLIELAEGQQVQLRTQNAELKSPLPIAGASVQLRIQPGGARFLSH